jgi:DNA-binding transcriptional LysR family regulator
LNRSTRGLSLTEIGAAFYEHCVRIADEATEAAELVDQLQSEPRGVLKVAVPVAFGRLHVAFAVADNLRLYPRVRLDMTTTDRLIDLVSEGYQLAIRVAREPSLRRVSR